MDGPNTGNKFLDVKFNRDYFLSKDNFSASSRVGSTILNELKQIETTNQLGQENNNQLLQGMSSVSDSHLMVYSNRSNVGLISAEKGLSKIDEGKPFAD